MDKKSRTELYIPFTKALRESVGFDKEIPPDAKVFRCLRLDKFFDIKGGDIEKYAEQVAKIVTEKYSEALLYSDRGLRKKLLNLENADEIYEKVMSMSEGDLPSGYFLCSRSDGKSISVFGYEDGIEAIIEKDGEVERLSSYEESLQR